MESLLSLVCIASITLVFVMPMWLWINVSERRARAEHEKAVAAGRHEPVTIQPLVNPSLCMGSGTCVSACPEDVLKVIDGQAVAVNMAACIGHGACVAACPVGAIELVFGSEQRGIEIPKVGSDFQTDVEGLFIAGELGGMGLVANAAEQGVQALRNATEGLRPARDGLDVVIVGAGPAGIAAAAAARVHDPPISYAVFEQEELGGALRHYPRKKLVLTRPMDIPGYGRLDVTTLHKEELERLFADIVEKLGIELYTRERVDGLRRAGDGFEVTTSQRKVRAQRVILALGRRGTPRKLDVPGEDLEKVAYSLLEPEQYRDNHILVVGGGDSALEAALQLSEQPGNVVTVSYRGEHLNRPKAANLARIQAAEASGAIRMVLSSTVTEIGRDRVSLEQNGAALEPIPNDFVFVMVGGVLPTKFLQDAGVEVERHFGRRKEAVKEKGREVARPAPAAAPPPAAPARRRPEPEPETVPIPDTLRAAPDALVASGQWDEAAEVCAEAVAHARRGRDRAALSRALAAYGWLWCELGRLDIAEDAFAEGLDAADTPEIRFTGGLAALKGGDLATAEARFDGSPWGLAACSAAAGDVRAALERCEDGLRTARIAGERGRLLALRAEVEAMAGRFAAALGTCEEAMVVARGAGHGHLAARAAGLRAELLATLGLVAEAKATLEALVFDEGSAALPAALRAARTALLLGRPREAAAWLEGYTAPEDPLEDRAAELLALRARALATSDPPGARRLARQVLARPVPVDVSAAARAAIDAAWTFAQLGATSDARDAVARGLQAVKGTGARGLRLELLALLAKAAPDPRVTEALGRTAQYVLDELASAPSDIAARASRNLRGRPEIARTLSG